jgi:nitroreductase
VFDLDETDRLLSTTRAVRRRLDLDRPVDPAVILECLRLAVQAPTGSNEQGWRWLVVTDPDTKLALAELYRGAGLDHLARQAAEAADGVHRRLYEGAHQLALVLERVPVLVIPCIEGRVDRGPSVVTATAYGSILPAAWSFLLALRARGLGSTWTTLHLVREREAAALLGIPDDVMQVAMFPVAHTIGDDFSPATRPPVEDITFWDHWGSTDRPT